MKNRLLLLPLLAICASCTTSIEKRPEAKLFQTVRMAAIDCPDLEAEAVCRSTGGAGFSGENACDRAKNCSVYAARIERNRELAIAELKRRHRYPEVWLPKGNP